MIWALQKMVGCKKIGHFRQLSNNREFLIHALGVYNPSTNTHQPHVVHKIPME